MTIGNLSIGNTFTHNGYSYTFMGIVQRKGRYAAQVASETGVIYLLELDREIEA